MTGKATAIRATATPPPAYNDRTTTMTTTMAASGGQKIFRSRALWPGLRQSEQVRAQLTDMGWRDFHGGQPQGDIVTLRARRPNGRLFELTMHRCSGADRRGTSAGTPPLRAVCLQSAGAATSMTARPRYGDRWRDGDNYAYRDRPLVASRVLIPLSASAENAEASAETPGLFAVSAPLARRRPAVCAAPKLAIRALHGDTGATAEAAWNL